MHGSIFYALNRFVEQSHGNQAWFDLLADAGFEGHQYAPSRAYPDAELLKLIETAANRLGVPVPALLRRFGEFIVPTLLKMYGAYVEPQWKTLDVIEHTESTMHSVVRMADAKAEPPHLVCVRSGPTEVVVNYRSERRLCSLALGIVDGLAKAFGEEDEIDEPQCMLRGDRECVIRVRNAVAAPAA